MKINNINALLLATAPVFAVYSLAGLTMTFFLIWFCIILNIFNQTKSSNQFRHPEQILFLGVLVLGFLSYLTNNGEVFYSSRLFINNLFPIVSFFGVLLLCTKSVNVDLFVKVIIWISLAASLICLFQRVQIVATGSYSNNFFIPGLEVKRDLENFSTRPSAFFTEPAHLAIYLLPVFYFLLRAKKQAYSIIIGLGILSSGSTTGFLLMFVLYIINSIKNRINKNKMFVSLLSMALLFSIVMYVSPDILLSNYEKLATSESSSSRLLGPLQYFGYFNFIQYIFGIGLNQLSSFLQSHGFVLLSAFNEEMDMNYANALIYMVLSYGIIGGFMLLRYLVTLFKTYNCKQNAGFYVILLGIMLSDQVLFNMNLLYPLVCVMLLTNYDKNSENEKDNYIIRL